MIKKALAFLTESAKAVSALVGSLTTLTAALVLPDPWDKYVALAVALLTAYVTYVVPYVTDALAKVEAARTAELAPAPVSGEIVVPITDQIPVPETDVIPVVEGDDARTEGPTVQDILSRVAAEYPTTVPPASHYSPETAEIPAQQS